MIKITFGGKPVDISRPYIAEKGGERYLILSDGRCPDRNFVAVAEDGHLFHWGMSWTNVPTRDSYTPIVNVAKISLTVEG